MQGFRNIVVTLMLEEGGGFEQFSGFFFTIVVLVDVLSNGRFVLNPFILGLLCMEGMLH